MANKKKKKNLNTTAKAKEVKAEPVSAESAEPVETTAAETSEFSADAISRAVVEGMKKAEEAEPADGGAEEEVNEGPSPEPKKKTEKMEDESSGAYLAKMVVVLTVICMSIALLLSVVNHMTKDVIAANEENAKSEAVLAVFPEGTDVQTFQTADGEEIYIVLKDGKILGLCVNAVAAGYVGDVSMMVGINTAHEVCGIKIVSMSETPGVGTKISGESFLERFFGMSEPAEIGGNVDGISGATYSSRAVADGVNAALAIMVDYEEIAASIGADISDGNADPADNINANEENGDEELNIGQAGESGAEDKLPETQPEETEPELVPEPEVIPEPEPEVTPGPEIPETPVEPEIPAWVEPTTEPEVVEPMPAPEVVPEPEPVPEPEATPEPIVPVEPTPVPTPAPAPEPEVTPEPEPEWTAPEVEVTPEPEWTEPEVTTPEPVEPETEAPVVDEPSEEEIIEEPEPEVIPEPEPEVIPEPEPETEETEEETEAPKKTIGGGFIKP